MQCRTLFLLLSLFAINPAVAAESAAELCGPKDSAEQCRTKVQLSFEALMGNAPKRASSFRDACTKNHDDLACAIYARWVHRFVVKDELPADHYLPSTTVYRLSLGCANTDGYACLGTYYAYDMGLTVVGFQTTMNDAWSERACKLGVASGCATAADRLLDHNRHRDEPAALRFAELGCQGKDPAGCTQLAFSLLSADGSEKARARALALYSEACELGSGAGCNGAGWMDDHGYATERSPARAEVLFDRACRLGDGQGCKNLGDHAEVKAKRGEGTLLQARELYQKACDIGFGGGCAEVARHHRDGVGVAISQARARELYSAGCDRYDIMSCFEAEKLVTEMAPYADPAARKESVSFIERAFYPGKFQILQVFYNAKAHEPANEH